MDRISFVLAIELIRKARNTETLLFKFEIHFEFTIEPVVDYVFC